MIMAKNYTIAEAVEVITEAQDNEALLDLGKRYPLLTQKITRVAVKAGEDFVDLMSYMPEHVSANKVNSAIKRALEESDVEDVDEDEDEEPKKKAPAKSNGKPGRPKKVQDDEEEDEEEHDATDYDSMNNAKMYKLLGELGKRKDCKEKFGDLSHDSMLKYLKKYGPGSAASSDDEDEEEEESGSEYEGKTAVELYKLCKQRKIKAEQKKPAKYYIGLLEKADAEAEEDTDADDDEWDDDEEEAPTKKPAKSNKKAAPKKSGKAAKKEEPEDDDDDDDEWEI